MVPQAHRHAVPGSGSLGGAFPTFMYAAGRNLAGFSSQTNGAPAVQSAFTRCASISPRDDQRLLCPRCESIHIALGVFADLDALAQREQLVCSASAVPPRQRPRKKRVENAHSVLLKLSNGYMHQGRARGLAGFGAHSRGFPAGRQAGDFDFRCGIFVNR